MDDTVAAVALAAGAPPSPGGPSSSPALSKPKTKRGALTSPAVELAMASHPHDPRLPAPGDGNVHLKPLVGGGSGGGVKLGAVGKQRAPGLADM